MLRLLIGTGVVLMAVGFGAAGWQYWQGQTGDAPADLAAPEDAGLPQDWLISATGAPVPHDDVRAYLVQARFVPSRTAVVIRTALLTNLLADGETLPEASYFQILADIRAPLLAAGLCSALTPLIARECTVNAARVVEGSVDPVQGTAQFRIELVYRQQPDLADLPDLALHVLRADTVVLDLAPEDAGAASAESALAALAEAAQAACAADPGRQSCRVLRLTVDWSEGRPLAARAEIGWLEPLPEGIFAAPSLKPTPEG